MFQLYSDKHHRGRRDRRYRHRRVHVNSYLGQEQNRTEILFVKTCTYIHHHTKHLIQLYTRDIQL